MTTAATASTAVFWDIDGTLLVTARAGVIALEEAMEEVCGGRIDLATMRTAGLTDGEIALLIVEAAAAAGHPVPDPRAAAEAFLASYASRLPASLPLRQGRVLDNVPQALAAVGAAPGVASLLLTGNLLAGAVAKLAHYGLHHHFPWPDAGAFCEGPEPRVAIARRAERMAAALGATRILVIGDTEHDVACGKAIGALTVGVATGPAPREELEAAEPWLLLDRLPEPQQLLRLLGIA